MASHEAELVRSMGRKGDGPGLRGLGFLQDLGFPKARAVDYVIDSKRYISME